MSGRNETLLEKVLKPIRINPVTLGVSLASFGIGALFANSDNTSTQISSVIMFGLGGSSLFLYFKYGVKSYLRDKENLIYHGFNKKYGVLRMEEYCDRQAFLVACTEQGYRDEAKELIRNTPDKQKSRRFLPHI
jgi:hypothetical protein